MAGLKKIDYYIIRKFLGTYLLTLVLFIIIAIVFDVTEKLEDFMSKKIALSEIVFTYYLNFIPYFAILFTPLFLFVGVIFFTSRMAYNSEIIAMLNSGITFNRLLVPYFIAAAVVVAFNIYANNWLLPDANKKRIAFENEYIGYTPFNNDHDIHMQIARNQFIYVQNFEAADSTGHLFAFEQFNNGNLQYKVRADRIVWDSHQKVWHLKNYSSRTNNGMYESISSGRDTAVSYNLRPGDFDEKENAMETLDAGELNRVIADLQLKGSSNVASYEVEKYRRTAFPFAIFILTLIGVALASRKVRGGIGLHLGLGIGISFTYIFFLQFSQTFSTNGDLPAVIGVWIPNLIFSAVALFLYRIAPK